MKELEKNLNSQFKSDIVPPSNTEEMWKELNKRRVRTAMKRKNKTFITAAASVLVLATGFAFSPFLADASETLISKLFGTQDEIQKVDPIAGEEEFQELEEMLNVAQSIFTESEFATFSSLINEQMELMKKVTIVKNNERTVDMEKLTEKERMELERLDEEIQSYLSRIDRTGEHNIEEAKDMAHFPINRPTFIPEGYELESETAKTKISTGKKQPIVEHVYSKGEFGFRIKQSSILQEEEDDFSTWSFNDVETYKINDYTIFFSKLDGSENVQGMKIVIPETAENEAYQLFIIADILSKEEMEKVMLSMLP